MTDYPAGTVAKATVRGVPDVTVMRYGPQHSGWFTPEYAGDAEGSEPQWRLHEDRDVTDVRPLVVLDLDYIRFESFGLPNILEVLRSDNRLRPIADQIEAQTKPPRIPEPGLWGVVEAETNFPTRRWVHHEEGRWIADTGTVLMWQDLRNPVLVRPGIEDAQ